MGVNHQDLFRRLPAAIGFLKYSIRGDTITIVDQQQQLLIRFGEVQERRVGALSLPTTRLDFTFSGFSNSAVVAFMERFDLYFRCGGG